MPNTNPLLGVRAITAVQVYASSRVAIYLATRLGMKKLIAISAALIIALAGLFFPENSEQASTALIVSNIWLAVAFLLGGKS